MPKKEIPNFIEEEIPLGYLAVKKGLSIKVFTQVSRLCIYVYIYHGNKIHDQVPKDTPSRANNFICKLKLAHQTGGFEITELGPNYKTKRDKFGYYQVPKKYKPMSP